MCGLVGFFSPTGLSAATDEKLVRSLAQRLAHRGPDDAGAWLDAGAGIALGHQRLAILDVSAAGHQPMHGASGRYVIVFNGEIYNHLEIREEIGSLGQPPIWRGHSDTETLLAGIDIWGVEALLERTAGMFAFALWDRRERVLTLARDRLGEKPLYYGWQGGTLLFGSELKALRAHPAFRAELDRDALALYLRNGYVPAPHAIYQGIYKLPPGTCLQVPAHQMPGSLLSPKPYWSLASALATAAATPFRGTDAEAIDQLEAVLMRAVSLQSIADVPLGAFLSGGTDSSTVVALLQAQSSRRVKTFTIGFHDAKYQEAGHARAIAEHLRTDHTDAYVTPNEAMEVIPKLPDLFDEPFGDSSAIPTYLVARLARRDVTVSLSGDGGDELFAGYTRYHRAASLWRAMRQIPGFARIALSKGARAVAAAGGSSTLAFKANRWARYLSAQGTLECYETQLFQRHDLRDLVPGSAALPDGVIAPDVTASGDHFYDTMMYTDTLSYLPDDILVKVDRASMAVSLESRVPLLDHRVLEFAWRLPATMKVRQGAAKWLLKQVLRRHVPDSLTERPKMGFGIPVGQWIRGPLRDWAEDLLSEARLRRDGYLQPRLVREQWSRHMNGGSTEGDGVWQILMFQAWLSARVRA